MKLKNGSETVHITPESLLWFLALTAVGTVLGGIAYSFVQPYLPSWMGGPETALDPNLSATPVTPPTSTG